MSNPHISQLTETEKESEAKFVRIDKVIFKCNLTEGKVYELHRNYEVDGRIFEDNYEAFIIDDNGKSNYSMFMMCKTSLLK